MISCELQGHGQSGSNRQQGASEINSCRGSQGARDSREQGDEIEKLQGQSGSNRQQGARDSREQGDRQLKGQSGSREMNNCRAVSEQEIGR